MLNPSIISIIAFPSFQADYPIIAPFYARVDMNQNDDRQMVYYRTMKRDLTVDDPGIESKQLVYYRTMKQDLTVDIEMNETD